MFATLASWLEVCIDPTALFAVSCILAPLYMLPDRPAQEEVVAYLTEPSMVAAMALLAIVSCIGALLRYRARHRRVTVRVSNKSSSRATTTLSSPAPSLTPENDKKGDCDGAVAAEKVKRKNIKGTKAKVNDTAMDKTAPESSDVAETGKKVATRPAVSRMRRYLQLTYAERTRARWYLINGIVFHMLMDGCVGAFKTNTLFARNYAKLDRRYAEPLGSYNGSAVHVISLVELFIKGPICILLYLAMQTRHPASDALEFFTCVTQAYGTVVYLGQEAISGAPNLDVDYDLTFSQHYLVYFWFAILFGCALYLIVPSILACRSFGRIVAHTSAATR